MLANHCRPLGIDAGCVRAVARKVVHLVGQKDHYQVEASRSAACNELQRHTQSETHKGTKNTIETYKGCIKRFCLWGNDVMGGTEGLLPLSRHVVVRFLEEESKRRLPMLKPRPPHALKPKTSGGQQATAPSRGLDDHSSDNGGSESSGSGTEIYVVGGAERPSAPKRQRTAAGTSPSAPGGSPTATLFSASAGPLEIGVEFRGSRVGASSAVGPATSWAESAAAAASPHPPRISSGATPPPPPLLSRGSNGGASSLPARDALLSAPSPPPRASEDAFPSALGQDVPLGRLVGRGVLQNDLNALSKVVALFNLLWHDAKCLCCKRLNVDDYLSAGSYRRTKAILDLRKRDGILKESAAGVAKAVGKRNVSVTDQQRALASKAMLLRQTTELRLSTHLRLNALWILQYALEARGETVRGLTWSDVARRVFDGFFSANGKGLDGLCCYIAATKTTEGLVRNVGALPHVDPWLRPFGALADALVAMFHPPGGDSSEPVFEFSPVFRLNDAELAAAGVQF